MKRTRKTAPQGAPLAPDTFASWHPILRPMRATCERMFEAGDYERAFPLLHALILLDGKPTFSGGAGGEQ